MESVAGGVNVPKVVALIGLCVLSAATVAACTSSPSTPEEATSCNGLVDLAVAAVVDARDSAENVTMSDFQTLEEEAQSIITRLTENRDTLSDRATELGCNSTEWNDEYRSRVLELTPNTEGGLYILQAGLFFAPF